MESWDHMDGCTMADAINGYINLAERLVSEGKDIFNINFLLATIANDEAIRPCLEISEERLKQILLAHFNAFLIVIEGHSFLAVRVEG
jgi:hypothetical protein